MGRIIKLKHRLEIDGSHLAWRGPANQKRLEQYIKDYAKSLEIGGTNQHISKSLGYIPYPVRAKIIRQDDGFVMASWQAATFQVW